MRDQICDGFLNYAIVDRIRVDPKFRRVLTGVWARQERKDFWDRITPLLYEYPTEPID
jgi:hypothetical protein